MLNCIHEHPPTDSLHTCTSIPTCVHSDLPTAPCSSIHVCMRQGTQPTDPSQTLLPSPKSLPILLGNREETVFWANVPFTSPPHGLACPLVSSADFRSLLTLPRLHTACVSSSHPPQLYLRPLLRTCLRDS